MHGWGFHVNKIEFPDYFYQSEGDGVKGLSGEDERKIKEEMDYYYSLRGWDFETGLPSTAAKLRNWGWRENSRGLRQRQTLRRLGRSPLCRNGIFRSK